MERKNNQLNIRNTGFQNKHYLGVFKEIRKMEKVRQTMGKNLPEVKGVRKVYFFTSIAEAEKMSEIIKKAHGIHKIGVNSRNDRIQDYANKITLLVYFIEQVDGLELEDRFMALEALWISESLVMQEFIWTFDNEDMVGETGYYDINGKFHFHKKFFKLCTVQDAVMKIRVKLDDMCKYYGIWSLEDF